MKSDTTNSSNKKIEFEVCPLQNFFDLVKRKKNFFA